MATVTETTVSGILKEVYPGEIEDQLNEEVALWALLDSQKEDVTGQGKHLIRPLRYLRAQGIGARPDNGTLPSAGNQSYIDTTINMASNYFRSGLSGRVMRSANGDQAAFDNVLQAEIRYGMGDFITDISRQLFTGAGQITTVNGLVTTSVSVVVKDVTNLQVGMAVEFWNAGANQTTNDSGITGSVIAAINIATKTLTMTTSQVNIATGAGVSRAGSNTATATSYELEGLNTIVDDLTVFAGRSYFGLSRTTYPILNGNVIDGSTGTAFTGDTGTTITENKMQYVMDQCRKIGGGFTDVVLCTYDTRRTYANVLQALKRYPVQGATAPVFAGGFNRSKDLKANLNEGLTYDGVPLIASRQAPAGIMFMLDRSTFHLYQQSDINWVMNGDSVLHPRLVGSNQDGYDYAFYHDAQLYNEAPNRNGKIINV